MNFNYSSNCNFFGLQCLRLIYADHFTDMALENLDFSRDPDCNLLITAEDLERFQGDVRRMFEGKLLY